MHDDIGEGFVTLSRDDWQAVMKALEGDEVSLDNAFEALQRCAPPRWLATLDDCV